MKGAVMKILVAGATGALGRQLVPRLVAGGHDVAGMTRSESKIEAVRSLGATPVVVDALEPEEVARAVGEVGPEIIVHQLTALAGSLTDSRHPDRAFALTDRLRTEGTDLSVPKTRSCSCSPLSLVLVDQSTEDVALEHSPSAVIVRRRRTARSWRLHLKCAVGPMTVEVLEVGAEDGLKVASSEDEDAIEALTPQSTDKPLRERVRLGSFDRSAHDP
jgi:NAD(P)H-binding